MPFPESLLWAVEQYPDVPPSILEAYIDGVMHRRRVFPAAQEEAQPQPIPVEIRLKDDHYEIRAEIPGVRRDDIKMTATSTFLMIEVERSQDEEEATGHSEFFYGRLARTVRFPVSIDRANIKATYGDGILSVSVAASSASSSPLNMKIINIE
ncbi:Hsp20/alpha crystallin family protein [Mycobacterium sp. 1245805.9]|uniref:Hsp20/alpha crystallin family protein n=1 Tax=Mycobacterium sp. 1245805.9 TaxID=1856862 RepID=UPI0009EF6570|nr:Hsp20/alpha crystallin family protein [Mycobacterium sp. 1245805.9]